MPPEMPQRTAAHPSWRRQASPHQYPHQYTASKCATLEQVFCMDTNTCLAHEQVCMALNVPHARLEKSPAPASTHDEHKQQRPTLQCTAAVHAKSHAHSQASKILAWTGAGLEKEASGCQASERMHVHHMLGTARVLCGPWTADCSVLANTCDCCARRIVSHKEVCVPVRAHSNASSLLLERVHSCFCRVAANNRAA